MPTRIFHNPGIYYNQGIEDLSRSQDSSKNTLSYFLIFQKVQPGELTPLPFWRFKQFAFLCVLLGGVSIEHPPKSPKWTRLSPLRLSGKQESNLMELVATLRVFAAQTIKRRPKNTRPSNLFLRRTFAIENNYKRIKIVFPKKHLFSGFNQHTGVLL